MKFPDLKALALGPSVAPKRSDGIPRHGAGQRFLKGPIPWDWLRQAGELPGKALHVGICIWLEVGMKRSANVKVSLSKVGREMGCDRTTASRGLQHLETAGLINVDRHPGRCPRVRVIAINRHEKNEKNRV
jgi:DNA-binding MarR family transcriptional regulator